MGSPAVRRSGARAARSDVLRPAGLSGQRWSSGGRASGTREGDTTSVLLYLGSIVVAGVGLAYASVPLYKMFCQATGFGGTAKHVTADEASKVRPVEGASPVTIQFAATTSDTLPWDFVPQQKSVRVVPGETALAFFTAYNRSDKPVVGISTYNITPSKAGVYFNKVQCFCFDMQRLKPKEEVDMPVLFYIDPAFANDPQMASVNNIVLSYTFFAAKGQNERE